MGRACRQLLFPGLWMLTEKQKMIICREEEGLTEKQRKETRWPQREGN